jgi:hypothetical protein
MKKYTVILAMLVLCVMAHAVITYGAVSYSWANELNTATTLTTVAVGDTATNYIKSTPIKILENTNGTIYITCSVIAALQHTINNAVVKVRGEIWGSDDGTNFGVMLASREIIMTGATAGKAFVIPMDYTLARPQYIQVRWVGMGANIDYAADIFGTIATTVCMPKY